MWFRRRHDREPGSSPPRPQHQPQPSIEAQQALAEAKQAKADAHHKRIDSEPLLADIRRLLRENDISKSIQQVLPRSAQ